MSRNEKPVVLIVEDNPTGIASLVGILGASCDLIVAESLAEAKRCLAPEVDLVLLDLYLPDGKGIEFLAYLSASYSRQQIPVICISASDQDKDIEEAFREGAIDYVLKPFNKTILSAKVSTFVDFKRKTDLLADYALQDPLTGVGNRRLFERQMRLEWRRAKRQQLSIGVAMVDLDYFKKINDQYGHAQGDACLQRLAAAMEKTFCRAGEVVARLGGDEFAAILPGVTQESVVRAAVRLNDFLEQERDNCRLSQEVCPNFTTSIGCFSMIPDQGSSLEELVEKADQYLYEAKREGGRDCVRPII